MMHMNQEKTGRRLWRFGRWLTPLALALLLSLTACGGDKTPAESDAGSAGKDTSVGSVMETDEVTPETDEHGETLQPDTRPAEESSGEGSHESGSESTGDSADESTGDSSDESTGDSSDESTGDSADESTGDSADESAGDSSGESDTPGTKPETPEETDDSVVILPPPETAAPPAPPEDVTLPDGETGTVESEPETLPYDPDLHPGDSAAYRGVMISAVHGTGKKGAEAIVDHGFVQLFNNTDKAISLKGAALYYKSEGANPYTSFLFADDASVPAGGYYLVRTNAPSDMVESNLVMKISKFDAEWDTYIDNKEVRLLLAPAGWAIGRDEDIAAFDDAISVFVASVAYHSSVYSVDDLSRSKIAVRTAMEDYSGYHLVNLTRTTTNDLQTVCPVNSKGEKNEVVGTRLREVYFSHAAGVYEDTFYLALTAPEGYAIYYTTDGSDPVTSTTKKSYGGPIYMADTSSVANGAMIQAWRPTGTRMIGGKVVKAYAVKGSETTPVYTNSYFVTGDLAALGVTVMSISIPKDDMLGNAGFYNKYNTSGIITDPRPRGTGILEVFDPNGNRVGNSRVEMAVSGNGSSGAGMKSLRIYYKSKLQYNLGVDADPDYPAYESAGTQSALHYDLFGGLAKDADGEVITSFSRLLLRNSGNDCGHSYIRDAYMQRVCEGLYVDTMASASVLMFVNGEFWGVYNARERYSPEYVESHYGVQKENVTILESDYNQLVYHGNPNADFVLSSGMEGDEIPFNEMLKFIRENDLALDENYRYVTDLMDIDSFIDLWVSRLIFNARDFPENNIKVWRNKNPDDPSGMDTKWHFTLLDMDMGLSYFPRNDPNNSSENANYFWFLDSGSTMGYVMRGLMRNEEFYTKFITRFYSLLKEHFTQESMSEILEEFIAKRELLMPLQESRWSSDGASVNTWRSDCTDMRDFVNNRNDYVLTYFLNRFGLTEDQIETMTDRRVSVSFHSGRADVTVNGEAITSGTVIKFEKDTTLTLNVTATAKAGYTVTEIIYTDRDGNKQRVEGSTATFKVTESGSLSIMTKREGQDGEQIGKGQLVAGATYLYYLSPDGDLYAWGDNRQGVLGLGTAGGSINTPTFVMSGIAKIVTSAGNAYENGDTTFSAAVLTVDGRVLTVGANSAGQLGRNGTTSSNEWGEIDFDGKLVDVSMGHDHLLIVDDKGNLWGIGANNYGALGENGTGGNVLAFQKIASNVESASAGRRSTVYLTQDGRLWGLGDNRWGKMSLSHGNIISTPIVMAENIVFVDSGEHQILAIDSSGKLYYAGWRTVSGFQQGAGNNPTLAEITVGGKVKKADIYHGNAVILTENGDAYVYGLNIDNGIGSMVVNGTALKVQSGITDVAAGYGFTAYLTEDGRILIQGSNANGQAGNGTVGGTVSFGEADF